MTGDLNPTYRHCPMYTPRRSVFYAPHHPIELIEPIEPVEPAEPIKGRHAQRTKQKRMPFGILLFILIRVFLLIDPMRHAPTDHQEEKQDETRAVLLKINEIMPQNHLDHDRGDLTDERRLEMFLR